MTGTRDHTSVAPFEDLVERVIDAGIKLDKVLDYPCGTGLLVRAFRKRGIEAFGAEASSESLESVVGDVRPYCRVRRPGETLDERYDLIVTLGATGRRPDVDGSAFLRSLTVAADSILFAEAGSSDALARGPNALIWMERFAGFGFAPSLTFAASPASGQCMMLLRRGPALPADVMRLLAECMRLRAESAGAPPSSGDAAEVVYLRERTRMLEDQLAREREYLDVLRGTHAFLVQEVQKLRSGSASTAAGPNDPALTRTVDTQMSITRIRGELGAETLGQGDLSRIVQDQIDLRAQFGRLERRTTGIERSLQNISLMVDSIVKSKIWQTLVSGAGILQRVTGRGKSS